jgi:hypothetical protein
MGKIGRISTVKEIIVILAFKQCKLSRNNMTRIPGTGVFRYPYKELDGKYRTGLDPTAAYINKFKIL